MAELKRWAKDMLPQSDQKASRGARAVIAFFGMLTLAGALLFALISEVWLVAVAASLLGLLFIWTAIHGKKNWILAAGAGIVEIIAYMVAGIVGLFQ